MFSRGKYAIFLATQRILARAAAVSSRNHLLPLLVATSDGAKARLEALVRDRDAGPANSDASLSPHRSGASNISAKKAGIGREAELFGFDRLRGLTSSAGLKFFGFGRFFRRAGVLGCIRPICPLARLGEAVADVAGAQKMLAATVSACSSTHFASASNATALLSSSTHELRPLRRRRYSACSHCEARSRASCCRSTSRNGSAGSAATSACRAERRAHRYLHRIVLCRALQFPFRQFELKPHVVGGANEACERYDLAGAIY